MLWRCKDCNYDTRHRKHLLQHYRLVHGHRRSNNAQPCLYADCPCSFNSWSSLKSHLNRIHKHDKEEAAQNEIQVVTFKCLVCGCNALTTEREYFQHIHIHLSNNETVQCMFRSCNFKTNVWNTFRSHKHRIHSSHTIEDFKNTAVTIRWSTQADDTSSHENSDDDVEVAIQLDENEADIGVEDLRNKIESTIASLLLKLEYIRLVSSSAVDELVEELHYASVISEPVIENTLDAVLKNNNCVIDKAIVKEMAHAVSSETPISKAFGKQGPLTTKYKRQEYYKRNFHVVKPVQYVQKRKRRKRKEKEVSFQYIPILPSLQKLLDNSNILDKAMVADEQMAEDNEQVYKTFRDGTFFKENQLLAQDGFQICLGLYIDDFEVCNPLGTSRKKHKMCGVYWVLSNLPPMYRSALSSINLAMLCRSNDVKKYGYQKMLKPLLNDLAILEEKGVYIEKLGEHIKGTVQCVAADNLGAHSLAGFVESFKAHYFCRHCMAQQASFQTQEASAFQLRTKDDHSEHVRVVQENETLNNCCGVKKLCVLTEKLKYFHVLEGYPPDVLHDFFEGIVPLELALCLNDLIAKNHITVSSLNEAIGSFKYLWNDKRDQPQQVSPQLANSKTIGGNGHENWTLIRLLPFLIGSKIPEGSPAWELLMNLKDIVEIVVAPSLTEETLEYLSSKITEHREQFESLFPDVNLTPKHHFIEHYPLLIRCFGPLVHLWTMRFEAKHSFFKQVARYINCFVNICYTLAMKHQFMMSYHLHAANVFKSALEVSRVSPTPVEIMKVSEQEAIREKYSDIQQVNLATTAIHYGTTYKIGMMLPLKCLGTELIDFGEIVHIIIMNDCLNFMVKKYSSWYVEHFRSYELTVSPCREMTVLSLDEAADYYPLASYKVAGKRMVTLKRFIV